MKGLLVKDLRLVLQRKQTVLIYLITSVLMGISMDSSFVIPYLTMLMGITALGTINYDEFDNGFPFLFSLPVDCKTYVAEKNIFVIMMELMGMVYGIAVMFVLGAVTGKPLETEGLVAEMAITFFMMTLLFSGMIYMQLKYGAERSRTVIFIIYGIIAAVLLAIKGFADKLMPRFERIEKTLANMNPRIVGCAGAVIVSGLCYVIYLFTVRMMNKKEF